MAFSKIAAENLGGSVLPVLSGTNLTSISAGKILQVQNVKLTGSVTSVTSTSLSATEVLDIITPSATSSKILVMMNCSLSQYEGSGTALKFKTGIYRDIGGAGYSLVYAGQDNSYGGIGGLGSGEYSTSYPTTLTFVDSPSTNSAVTYKLYIAVMSGDNVNTGASSMERSVTLMEIDGS